MNNLQRSIIKMNIKGKLENVLPFVDLQSVAISFDENDNITKNLAEQLAEMLDAIDNAAKTGGITREDLQAECTKVYNKVLGLTDSNTTVDDAYDTLVEVAEWISGHDDVATTLVGDVSKLKEDLTTVTEALENITAGTTVEKSNTNGNIKVNGEEVEVYRNPGSDVYVAKNENELTNLTPTLKEGDIVFVIANSTGGAKADTTALENFINENASLDSSSYTEETWTAYQTALETAQTVLNNSNATQEEVDTALSNLQTTKNNLSSIIEMELKDAPWSIQKENLFVPVPEDEWQLYTETDTEYIQKAGQTDGINYGPIEIVYSELKSEQKDHWTNIYGSREVQYMVYIPEKFTSGTWKLPDGDGTPISGMWNNVQAGYYRITGKKGVGGYDGVRITKSAYSTIPTRVYVQIGNINSSFNNYPTILNSEYAEYLGASYKVSVNLQEIN